MLTVSFENKEDAVMNRSILAHHRLCNQASTSSSSHFRKYIQNHICRGISTKIVCNIWLGVTQSFQNVVLFVGIFVSTKGD